MPRIVLSAVDKGGMAALIGKVIDGYNTLTYTWAGTCESYRAACLWNERIRSLFADDRTKDWFLVGSPLVPMAVVYFYLKIVRDWGPKFMENRQPFDLKRILLVYNIVQVILSVHLFYEVGYPFFSLKVCLYIFKWLALSLIGDF